MALQNDEINQRTVLNKIRNQINWKQELQVARIDILEFQRLPTLTLFMDMYNGTSNCIKSYVYHSLQPLITHPLSQLTIQCKDYLV